MQENDDNNYDNEGIVLVQDILIPDMELLGIKNPERVFYDYVASDNILLNFLNRRYYKSHNLKDNLKDNKINQNGGVHKVNKIECNFENYDFQIIEIVSSKDFDISIKRKNNIESPEFCVHIMIDKDYRLAYIKNISYYIDCAQPDLIHPGGGGVLLRLCLKYLRENKKKYKIERIQLLDNSFLNCKPHKINVYLSMLHTLVYGDTWYGKYGFRPYNSYSDEPDKNLLKLYERNKKIVKTKIVKETNLFKHLYKVLKKNRFSGESKIKESELIKFDEDFNKYKKKTSDLTIGVFFEKFLKNFDDKCEVFQEFYLNFCADNGIHNFHGGSFYLDI